MWQLDYVELTASKGEKIYMLCLCSFFAMLECIWIGCSERRDRVPPLPEKKERKKREFPFLSLLSDALCKQHSSLGTVHHYTPCVNVKQSNKVGRQLLHLLSISNYPITPSRPRQTKPSLLPRGRILPYYEVQCSQDTRRLNLCCNEYIF